MNDFEQYFKWPDVQLHHFYIYFVIAAVIALYLTIRCKAKYKIELFFLSFYLLSGNINDLLTIKIPGFSFFEIQPLRFVYLLLFFFIIRKTLFSKEKLNLSINQKVPWFQVALFAYVLLLIVSVFVNASEIGISEVLIKIIDTLAFLAIMISLRLMADKQSYNLIGRMFIIGAVLTSIVSLIQLSIDPYFLRIGDDRLAFGNTLRSNGIFSTEYYNSYYLITAIGWALVTVKNNLSKIVLICLFSLGVVSTFQRMSWIVLTLIVVTYIVIINKVAIEKLLLAGLTCMAILLSISLFYYQDIMNSTLVKERLTEGVNSRKGYYSMVIDNIGKKPIFGYGGLKNEVYYVNMLRITGDRDRATATTGDLHSGYFSTLFLYGVPAFICFTLFVLLSVFYYSRSFNDNFYFVIPFIVSILYLIGNLTNTFLFLNYISVLYAIHIGIGMGIKKIGEQTTS